MTKKDILSHLYKIAQGGDSRSFNELYRHYFPKLLRLSISIVHNKESSEEIVHDVFMKIWGKSAHLHKIENPDVYFYIAVKNKSLEYLRKEKSREIIDISEAGSSYLIFDIDPERLMITEEMRKRILHTINQLPPRCRLIFKLIKEDGLKHKEVASILNISVKTVEAQMTIAIRKLVNAILIYTNEGRLQKENDIML